MRKKQTLFLVLPRDPQKIRRTKTMLKKILIALTPFLLVLLAIGVAMPLRGISARPASQTARSPQRAGSAAVATDAPTGTLQKMIVENGSVTMDLDLNRLRGIGFQPMSNRQDAGATTMRFAVAANSFFPVLIFNDQLRGLLPG